MRHFDAWLLRDPYSIFHYYSTGRRWQEAVRDMIKERKICAPSIDLLSSPSSSPVDPYARPVAPQPDSLFLSKLPAEIRLMIYEYAFGDEVVHLVQVKDKIRHVRCKHTTSSLDKNRRCCPVTLARWRAQDTAETLTTATATPTSTSPTPNTPNTNMLYPHTHPNLPNQLSNSSASLLRTCRTIYAEAATLLYKTPTFDIDDLHTFIAFSLTISPHHLQSITRLSIQYTPLWQPMANEEHKSSIYAHTHNDRLWALFWTRVAALPALQELLLTLDLGSFTGSPATGLIGGNRLRLHIDEPWVAPLLCVRGLRGFELGITVKCDGYARGVLQEELCRDAGVLRDGLRGVLCSSSSSSSSLPSSLTLTTATAIPPAKNFPVGRLRTLMFQRACGVEMDSPQRNRNRPRLAITAA